MNNKKTIFIILTIIGIAGLVLVLYIIIASKSVEKQFSTAKVNTYKNYVQVLLSEAYTERVVNSNSSVSCNKLGSYNSDYTTSCDITFDSSKSPIITIVGNGIYKEYCIYSGTMYNLEVVRCK